MSYADTNETVIAIRYFFAKVKCDETFNGIDLINYVCEAIGRPYRYGDTIMRYAREMKQRKEINFVCTNPCKARYKKIAILECDQTKLAI